MPREDKDRQQQGDSAASATHHASAEALKDMAEKGNFDALLMAMNHWGGDKEKREEGVIPCALGMNMGVLLMKAVRPKETVPDVKAPDLIRYALSLEGPHEGLFRNNRTRSTITNAFDIS